MAGEHHGARARHDNDVTTLRPTGWGRYFEVVFLAVWLTFWTVGEAMGVALLAWMFVGIVAMAFGIPLPFTDRMPPTDGVVSVFFLFGLFWVLLWTVGGVAALTHFLRSLAGADRVHVSHEGLHIERRAGPFRRRRVLPNASIRRVRQRGHDRALVADTTSGTIVVTQFGTRDDRTSLEAWLRERLVLPTETQAKRIERETPPHGWEVDAGASGIDTRFARPTRQARRTQAIIMWSLTAVVVFGWIGARRAGTNTADEIVCLVFTVLLGMSAIWITWGRVEWVARHGQLIARQRFLNWWRDRSFDASDGATLDITHTTDSDGDDRFALVVRTPTKKRTITTDLYDSAEIIGFGEWLAERTSLPLHTLSR
jgi:hypothetical protein